MLGVYSLVEGRHESAQRRDRVGGVPSKKEETPHEPCRAGISAVADASRDEIGILSGRRLHLRPDSSKDLHEVARAGDVVRHVRAGVYARVRRPNTGDSEAE